MSKGGRDMLDREHSIASTGIPSGEEHPPWKHNGKSYGPANPGAYAADIKRAKERTHWKHEEAGESAPAGAHERDEKGRLPKMLCTVSPRSASFVAKVKPRLDPNSLSPTERRVWEALGKGHATRWIAGHVGCSKSDVGRIKAKLEAGGMVGK